MLLSDVCLSRTSA